MMTPYVILTRAKVLLVDREWIQYVYSKDTYGCVGGPVSPSAVCFCSLGALCTAALNGPCSKEVLKAVAVLNSCLDADNDLVSFNDALGRTKEEVLGLFDCAIKKAQSMQLGKK